MSFGRFFTRLRPLHLAVAVGVGVSSGQYIFAPALRDYFKQLPDEVRTGQPAPPEPGTRPQSNNWSEVWKHVSTTSQPAKDADQALQSSEPAMKHQAEAGAAAIPHKASQATLQGPDCKPLHSKTLAAEPLSGRLM
ncbi:hypothetical protein WJX74_004786 [Apatococcus lobatus]|uniref:Uncharacterized protein n=1 Tax=Apatococcus lobatus TaxID=904363 RepID=A0AAW1QHY9_9CHLO